jgi:hypothetical protein
LKKPNNSEISAMPKPENIIPHKYKKGQSGNPKGRPPIRDIKVVLQDLLSQEKNGTQLIDGLMSVVVNKALKGDLKAVDMLLSYTFGKATQRTEITGSEGEPIQMKHDLSKLNIDELKQLKEITSKLEGGQ